MVGLLLRVGRGATIELEGGLRVFVKRLCIVVRVLIQNLLRMTDFVCVPHTVARLHLLLRLYDVLGRWRKLILLILHLDVLFEASERYKDYRDIVQRASFG